MTKISIVQHALVIVAAVFSFISFSESTIQTHNDSTGCRGANLQSFQGVRLSEKLYGLPGIDNAGRISPCIYRGKQPSSEGYQTLKAMGIKTVINLRSAHGERREVEDAGLRYLEFPLSMTSGIRRDLLHKIVLAMSDPSNQPVYIHCALGQDRTGVVVAAYRMALDGWSYEDAEKEMQSFGFNDTWIHLKQSLKDFSKHRGKAHND